MQLRTALAVFALFTTGACHKDDGGGHNGSGQKVWDFGNTNDKAAFQAKLADLSALTVHAQGVALPHGSTRGSSMTTALAMAESFADSSSTSAQQPNFAAADCADLESTFNLDGLEHPNGSGLRVTEGTSCGDALQSVRSYYANAVDSMQQTVNRMRTWQPGQTVCGLAVADLAVDPATAALGLSLTPAVPKAGISFEEKLLGASNDTSVGYLITLDSACDGSLASCGGAATTSLTGRSEASADLSAHKAHLANDYQLEALLEGGKGESNSTFKIGLQTSTDLDGLGDGETPKAAEDAAYRLEGPDGTVTAHLTLTAEALSATRLRLSGSVSAQGTVNGESASVGNGNAPATFTMDLQRSGDSCAVVAPEAQQPDQPSTQAQDDFAAADLQGEWATDCEHNSVGHFGYVYYEENLLFTGGGGFAQRFTPYSTGDCFAGKEQAVIELTGQVQVLTALTNPTTWDVPNQLGLNYSYNQLHVTLNTPELVSAFNSEKVCGLDDWTAGTEKTFNAGVCSFDMGNQSLLNLYALRRTTEFSALAPENKLVINVARTSNFDGDSQEVRARASNGGTVRFKKLGQGQ